MAARQEDFFTGDDLDATFSVIDNDILEELEETNVQQYQKISIVPTLIQLFLVDYAVKFTLQNEVLIAI